MSFTKSDDKNIFALVDCNNFYVSCERVFNPFLINQPVVVLSNNDGCIIARSNEVKDLGIPMGAPFHHINIHYCKRVFRYILRIINFMVTCQEE